MSRAMPIQSDAIYEPDPEPYDLPRGTCPEWPEVVRGRVVGDFPAARLCLLVGRAVMQARPDAGLGDLPDCLREAVEGAGALISSTRSGELLVIP
jgi:hypothetical protein